MKCVECRAVQSEHTNDFDTYRYVHIPMEAYQPRIVKGILDSYHLPPLYVGEATWVRLLCPECARAA